MQPIAYGYKPELGPIPQLCSAPKLNRSTLLSSTREPNMQAVGTVINLKLALSPGSALIAAYEPQAGESLPRYTTRREIGQ